MNPSPTAASPWARLRDGLAALGPIPPAAPATARQGAALILLRDVGEGDLELVLTRRRDDLANHPGQISFPGGRVDRGERVEDAAVREAVEEVGLDPATVELLGRLPTFFIPPSRFWLTGVVARWQHPHPLVAAEQEVAEVLTARLSLLRDPTTWRCVQLSSRGAMWAWQLDDRHLLWGATAVITAVLLGMIDPDWHGGRQPTDLPADCDVRPWEGEPVASDRPRRARLPGIPDIPGAAVGVADRARPPDPATARASGALVADAVTQLRASEGPVIVLVGPGGTGAVGMAAARSLAARGVPVEVLLSREDLHPEALADGLAPRPFEGSLPGGAVFVDALLGRGTAGPLRDDVRGVVEALKAHGAPILSVDLPTGVDPARGLVGDTVSADVTVALDDLAPGLMRPGMVPFVGDLYVVHQGDLRRVVGAPGDGRWRE